MLPSEQNFFVVNANKPCAFGELVEMTKPLYFWGRERFSGIGQYSKAFTGVLSIYKFDSQVGTFLLKP